MGILVADPLPSYDSDLYKKFNFMLPMIKVLKHRVFFILIMRLRLIPLVGFSILLVIIGII